MDSTKKINKKLLVPVIISAVVVAMIILILFIKKQNNKGYVSIKVIKTEGNVTVDRKNTGKIIVSDNMNLQSGDKVTTDSASTVVLELDTDKYVYLDENGEIDIVASKDGTDTKTDIVLCKGSVLNEIKNPLSEKSSYDVTSPNATMSVRGTVFEVRLVDNKESVLVFDGKVAVAPEGQEVQMLEKGECSQFSADKNPQYIIKKSEITEDMLNANMVKWLSNIEHNGSKIDISIYNSQKVIKETAENVTTTVLQTTQQPTEKTAQADNVLQQAKGNVTTEKTITENVTEAQKETTETENVTEAQKETTETENVTEAQKEKVTTENVTEAQTEKVTTENVTEAQKEKITIENTTEAPNKTVSIEKTTSASKETVSKETIPMVNVTTAPKETTKENVSVEKTTASMKETSKVPQTTQQSSDNTTNHETESEQTKPENDHTTEPEQTKPENEKEYTVTFYDLYVAESYYMNAGDSYCHAAIKDISPKVYDVQQAGEKNKINVPSDPEAYDGNEKLKFMGWYTYNGEKLHPEQKIFSNMEYYPVWENSKKEKYYPMTYISNENEFYRCNSVKENSIGYEFPGTIEGYEFIAWVKDDGSFWGNSTEKTDGFEKLTAYWSDIRNRGYKVSFITQFGDVVDVQFVQYGNYCKKMTRKISDGILLNPEWAGFGKDDKYIIDWNCGDESYLDNPVYYDKTFLSVFGKKNAEYIKYELEK